MDLEGWRYMIAVRLKCCPRCGGDLSFVDTPYEWWSCLQCGHIIWADPPKDSGNRRGEGRHYVLAPEPKPRW